MEVTAATLSMINTRDREAMRPKRDTRGRFISAASWTALQNDWERVALECEARARTDRAMARLSALRSRKSPLSRAVSAILPHMRRAAIVAITIAVLNPSITIG